MKVYVEQEIPKACEDCKVADCKGWCLPADSRYYFWKKGRPWWCPIEE